MAVRLQHNYNILFIATQYKIMAIIFYITNYITKVEDLVWKWVVVVIKLFRNLNKSTTEHQVKTVETADSYRKGNNI